jgi:hypothetical protein
MADTEDTPQFLALDNRLPILAEEIRVAHRDVLAAVGTSVTAARVAGRALIEAKQKLAHGRWLPWLRDLGLGTRTAQNYMQLARLDEANAQRVSHLGVKGALRERPPPPVENPELRRLLAECDAIEMRTGQRFHEIRERVGVANWKGWARALPAECRVEIERCIREYEAAQK